MYLFTSFGQTCKQSWVTICTAKDGTDFIYQNSSKEPSVWEWLLSVCSSPRSRMRKLLFYLVPQRKHICYICLLLHPLPNPTEIGHRSAIFSKPVQTRLFFSPDRSSIYVDPSPGTGVSPRDQLYFIDVCFKMYILPFFVGLKAGQRSRGLNAFLKLSLHTAAAAWKQICS